MRLIRNKLIAFFIVLLIIPVEPCTSQIFSSGRDLFISAHYANGLVFPMHKSITYFVNENINGIDLRVGSTFPDINPSRPPELGLGFYISNLGNRNIYGYTNSLYFYFNSIWLRNILPFSLEQSIATGAGYLTKRYDVDENNFNRAIGSHLNIFFIYSLSARIDITKDLILKAGPSIVHMSNGNITQPNFGINLINTNVGLTWMLKHSSEKKDLPENNKEWDRGGRFLLLFNGGIRQISRTLTKRYLTSTVMAEYSYRITRNAAIGAGADYFYDPTEGRESHITGRRTEDLVPWHAGLHLSYEVIWGNLSFVLQPGYKVITPSDHAYNSFNRLGIRYLVLDKYAFNFSIKSHKFAADYFELGAGYMIRKK